MSKHLRLGAKVFLCLQACHITGNAQTLCTVHVEDNPSLTVLLGADLKDSGTSQ
jgi:hypothetical protein